MTLWLAVAAACWAGVEAVAGPSQFVTCKTTASDDMLVIELKPEWAPRGVRGLTKSHPKKNKNKNKKDSCSSKLIEFVFFFFFFFFFRLSDFLPWSMTSSLTTRLCFASSRQADETSDQRDQLVLTAFVDRRDFWFSLASPHAQQ